MMLDEFVERILIQTFGEYFRNIVISIHRQDTLKYSSFQRKRYTRAKNFSTSTKFAERAYIPSFVTMQVQKFHFIVAHCTLYENCKFSEQSNLFFVACYTQHFEKKFLIMALRLFF